MFERVTLLASDVEASRRFYETVLWPLVPDGSPPQFALAPATRDAAVTRGLHIAFFAPSRAHVDAFWRAGIQAGYADDGAPGPRPQYSPDYYGGFLLDPDGNSAEAVHHGSAKRAGAVDHLWIRVADVAAAKAFYELVGPHADFELGTQLPERVHFRRPTGSFALVRGRPTQHAHLTFRGAAEAFLQEATAAGYRVEAGSAFDPDGNEVVVAAR